MTARLGVGAVLVDGRLVPGDLVLSEGRVVAHVADEGDPALIAAPGLVDLQVNGAYGVDVLTAGTDELALLEERLLADGVTAWQPTLITAPEPTTMAALERLTTLGSGPRSGRPHLLGVHLEGPFLAPGRLGVHPPEHRRDPDPALAERLTACPLVRTVTLAPELPGALALVAAFAERGILVSVGHTDADATTAEAAFDAGARTVTHLGNAMRPLSPRDPGVLGTALSRDDVTVQLIADAHHLAPQTIRMAARAARGRWVLVTDAVAAAGLGDGPSLLGDIPVVVADGAVRRADGTLAGSALTMLGAVRHAVSLGIDRAEALTAASTAPARLLGRDDLGALSPGAVADVIVLDRDLDAARVLREGREVARGSAGAP